MTKTIYAPPYRALILELKRARLADDITQAEAGERAGLSRTCISKIETFERRADILDVHRLAGVYGLRLSDLEPLLGGGAGAG